MVILASAAPHPLRRILQTWRYPAIAFFATLTGCLEDLPDPTLIDDLRVLTVRAEPPEVSPGATVMLDALVVDPLNRPRTYAWYACIVSDQAGGFFGGGGETSTSGGRGNALSTDPYGDSCRLRYEAGERWAMQLGNDETATLVVPSDLFDSQDALKAAYGLSEDLTIPIEVETGFLAIAGLNYRVTLTVEVDGRRIESQKRVNISRDLLLENNRPNLNPDPPSLFVTDRDAIDGGGSGQWIAPTDGRCFVDGAPPITSGRTYDLMPVNLPNPPPRYLVLLAGTTTTEPFEIVERDEVLFFSFFTTKGSLDKVVSKSSAEPSNAWKTGAQGPTDLWVVARDGRGGTSWCHERVVVLPR